MSVERAEELFERVNAALRSGRSDDRLWIGLGLENVPGKPFGYAFERERAAIRAHIYRKLDHPRAMIGARKFWNTHRGMGVEFAVTKMQERLHRNAPTFRERQEAWRARQPGYKAPKPSFTKEELERLVELFEGANDPLTASIAGKAATLLLGP